MCDPRLMCLSQCAQAAPDSSARQRAQRQRRAAAGTDAQAQQQQNRRRAQATTTAARQDNNTKQACATPHVSQSACAYATGALLHACDFGRHHRSHLAFCRQAISATLFRMCEEERKHCDLCTRKLISQCCAAGGAAARAAGAQGRQDGAPWFGQVPEHKVLLQPFILQSFRLQPCHHRLRIQHATLALL